MECQPHGDPGLEQRNAYGVLDHDMDKRRRVSGGSRSTAELVVLCFLLSLEVESRGNRGVR